MTPAPATAAARRRVSGAEAGNGHGGGRRRGPPPARRVSGPAAPRKQELELERPGTGMHAAAPSRAADLHERVEAAQNGGTRGSRKAAQRAPRSAQSAPQRRTNEPRSAQRAPQPRASAPRSAASAPQPRGAAVRAGGMRAAAARAPSEPRGGAARAARVEAPRVGIAAMRDGGAAVRRVAGPISGRVAAVAAAAAALPLRETAPAPQPRRRPAPAPVPRPARGARADLPLGARLVGWIRALPDHRLLDRLIGGRLWIVLICTLLVGLVTLQLSLLKLNAGIGTAVEQSAKLEEQNRSLQGDISRLSDSERVVAAATQMGLVMPPQGSPRFVRASGGDTGNAVRTMRAPDAATAAASAAISTDGDPTAEEIAAAEAATDPALAGTDGTAADGTDATAADGTDVTSTDTTTDATTGTTGVATGTDTGTTGAATGATGTDTTGTATDTTATTDTTDTSGAATGTADAGTTDTADATAGGAGVPTG